MSTASAASRILLLAAAALGTGCASVPPASGSRLVLELPEGLDPWWVAVSPGGGAAAYAERRGSAVFLVTERGRLGPFP